MKKLLLICWIGGFGMVAFSQGTVNFVNGSYALISTIDWSKGQSGPTPTAVNGFYYGLFTASSTVPSASVGDLLTPRWTFTGSYATNIAAAGRLSGGNGVATLTGWAPGATNSFLVAGWTSGLGHDWSSVSNRIITGTVHAGGNGFGISSVGFGMAGGGTAGIPALSLWAPGPDAQGFSLTQGFYIELSAIPEPSAAILLFVAALSFACCRRRNMK